MNESEIDFVAQKAQELLYIQVAETVKDPTTLERELWPLRKADGFHRRFLITTDHDSNASYDGILHNNIIDWLLEP